MGNGLDRGHPKGAYGNGSEAMKIPHAQNNTILPQHSASVTSLDYTFLNKLSANIIMASLLKSLKRNA